MMFDLVVRGGQVVRADGIGAFDIGVVDGVIRAVTAPGEGITARNEIDVAGSFVLPGLVDAHVHIPGFVLPTELDDFDCATRAAAAGGVTTVLLMPTDEPRTDNAERFTLKRDSGTGRSYVDYALQAMIGPMTQSITDLADLGAVSFELFLAYGGMPDFIVGDDDFELTRLLALVRDAGGIAGITPHSPSLIRRLTEVHRDDPRPTVATRAATRTVLSETLGLARACTAAAESGTVIHLRALSSRRSVELVRAFRGLARLSSEVMCHHLLFTADEAERMGAYGVITPPIRSADDRAALWDAVRCGEIDIVVSDHSPCPRWEKELGQADIWQAPPGMTGLQTVLVSMLALVDDGVLGLTDVVRLCCEEPARRFRLHPQKGKIAVGSDADLVVLDPQRSMLVEDRSMFSRANYTTLAGRRVGYGIETVMVRGKMVFSDGGFVAPPHGRFVRPMS
jgi:dihydroorotase